MFEVHRFEFDIATVLRSLAEMFWLKGGDRSVIAWSENLGPLPTNMPAPSASRCVSRNLYLIIRA